jgi:hypothetical protein
MENCIIMPHDFFLNSLFDFVYVVNLKNKRWSSMPNDMPMVNISCKGGFGIKICVVMKNVCTEH